MAMTEIGAETSFHFPDVAALYAFRDEVKKLYPTDCTDELGNTCLTVAGRALDFAMDVDHSIITEEQARARAKDSAVDVANLCRLGLSQTRRCGYGVLCRMGD